ncbi:hypothetical protein, partial [Acidithiobacillus thiooxidans]|uniref:hypothetical protein n=1 Tax=Acidithiobacillus thiooxidans TaxID=930 RepID=UPI001C070549
MDAHILHGRLAARASGSLLFLGFFSKSKHVMVLLFAGLRKDVVNRDAPRLVPSGVCQGSCRVTHFLSNLFILPLRVQIYRT